MTCKNPLHKNNFICNCEKLEGIECCACCNFKEDCEDNKMNNIKPFDTLVNKDVQEIIKLGLTNDKEVEEIADELMDYCVCTVFGTEPPFTCNEEGSHCNTCWINKIEKLLEE